MSIMVKFSAAVAVFGFLVSCHSELPELLPFADYKYCGYTDADNAQKCKSTYFISEKECKSGFVGGKIYENINECEEAAP